MNFVTLIIIHSNCIIDKFYDLEQRSKECSECFDVTNIYFTQILNPEVPEV